jgi:hypothetical protein
MRRLRKLSQSRALLIVKQRHERSSSSSSSLLAAAVATVLRRVVQLAWRLASSVDECWTDRCSI